MFFRMNNTIVQIFLFNKMVSVEFKIVDVPKYFKTLLVVLFENLG